MEIDLDTMLDIALAGPEIGPLNLHVLHGLMRNVFERLNISKERVKVDDSQSEFSDSCNFIRSKLDAIPKSASGENRRLKSKVSVIVSNYARVPIGEQQQPDIDSMSNCPLQIEERLKCVETALSSMKDFPSVNELRDWAKEKSSPDTVVTDLWHFVSLNHRMNGAEEGIQKLTELVDKLIPELKSVWEEGIHMSGRIDDLYSQFKGLSDRMTYIDDKIDAASQDIAQKIEDMETRLMQLPTHENLKDYVTVNQYIEAEDAARRAANEMRENIAQKLDLTQAELLASKDELRDLDEKIEDVNARLNRALKEQDNYVTKDDFAESLERLDDSLSYLDQKVDGKADSDKIEELESELKDKTEKINENIGNLQGLQESLQDDIEKNRKCINEKSKASDLAEINSKINRNKDAISDLENWKDAYENDDKALILSRLDQNDVRANELNKTLCALKEEEEKAKEMAKENEEEEKVSTRFLQDGQNQMQEKFNAHAQACNDSFKNILSQLEDKLNRDELTPLKDYIDSSLKTLPQQHPLDEETSRKIEELIQNMKNNQKAEPESKKMQNDQDEELPSVESPIEIRISPNNEGQTAKPAGQENQNNKSINGVHQPSPPPYNNRHRSAQISPKRFSTNESLGCSHPQYDQSQFIPFMRDDAAIIRTQMKFNCLSCGRPLCMQGNQHMQTTRGRPLNAYDLENMRLLQSMLNQESAVEKEKRSCGGRHTTSITPLPSSAKPSAKILPMVNSKTNSPVDEEVDIEGVDGRLYRGLVNKTELPMLQNT